MKRATKIASAATLGIGVVAVAGLTVANAATGDDGPDDDGADTAISGDALRRASEVALAHTGGGQVTGSEINDEEGKYEIEVRLDNGHQVDVHLDEQFNVLNAEDDGSGDAN
jgi:uncharacterized membrane protein YkoI